MSNQDLMSAWWLQPCPSLDCGRHVGSVTADERTLFLNLCMVDKQKISLKNLCTSPFGYRKCRNFYQNVISLRFPLGNFTVSMSFAFPFFWVSYVVENDKPRWPVSLESRVLVSPWLIPSERQQQLEEEWHSEW